MRIDRLKKIKKQRRIKVFVLALAFIIVISGIVFYLSNHSLLPKYISKKTVEEETTVGLDMDMKTYVVDDTGFSISVPVGWTEVMCDNTMIFSQNGSSVEITKNAYNPYINNYTLETIKAQVQNNGYIFAEYSSSTNERSFSYYKETENNVYDYLECYYWDRDMIINVKYVINESDIVSLLPMANYSCDSVKWEHTNVIPDDIGLYFSENGSYEFAVPSSSSWTMAAANNGYTITDSNTNSVISVSAVKSTDTFDGVSQIQYISYISSGRSNVALTSFKNSGYVITSEATCIINDVTYCNFTEMIATGSVQYMISVDIPKESYDNSAAVIVEQIFSLFRYFT